MYFRFLFAGLALMVIAGCTSEVAPPASGTATETGTIQATPANTSQVVFEVPGMT